MLVLFNTHNTNNTHKSWEEGKDQESIQSPHLTKDTTWESNKNTIKHHTQESQEDSSFPAGDHKATMNRQKTRQTRNTNNKNDICQF